MLHIQRDRWIIVKDNNQIFCGMAQQYCFKNIHEIGDKAIKTYSTKNKAISGFKKSWIGAEKLLEENAVQAINVVEQIFTRDFVGENNG